MRFVCIGSAAAEQDALKNEYKAAKQLGEVRISEDHLFYRYFIKIRYISLAEIARAYLREESGESGEFLLLEHYLMLKTQDGALHKFRMERETNVREVLHHLEVNYPYIAIGFDG